VEGAAVADKTVDGAADRLVLNMYLNRIGFTPEEITALIAQTPNTQTLQTLLTKHLNSIPFENLGQHGYGALPSLDTAATLKKLIFDKRGGFCFEVNGAFVWLLRKLGYQVRLSCSNVITPGGPVPGHLCLLVDGLGPEPLLVDPGFGDAPRAPLPVRVGSPVVDTYIGDEYTLAKNDDPSAFGQSAEQAKRFDLVLMRARKVGMASSPMVDFIGLDATPPAAAERTPPEPVYLLNSSDNCTIDCDDFVEGLNAVLADVPQNPFSQKRMCILLNDAGFTFVGKNYVKTIEHGKETSRTPLDENDEKAYLEAIRSATGMELPAQVQL